MEKTQNQEPQEVTWAIVEVMGHYTYAGRVQPDTSMGTPMIRVDVPETEGVQAFTKLLAPGSLFGITPCTEEVARKVAERVSARPVTILGLGTMAPALPGPSYDEDEDDFEEEDPEESFEDE